jgi:putative LysE/RhtB family amino acid efflux pump
MADIDPLLRGVSIGLTVAVPVGPMAILCVRHTLASGAGTGLFFGAGIASADTTYAAIAAIGVAAITTFLDDHENAIRLVGGLIMVGMGLGVLSSGFVPSVDRRMTTRLPATAAFAIAFGLTIANPMTIMIFAGLLAGYGATLTEPSRSIAVLLAGVFAGSMGWWLVVVMATSSIRVKTTERWLRRLSMFAGAGILLFGVLATVSALR